MGLIGINAMSEMHRDMLVHMLPPR
jgi:hypothetical protein